MSKSNRGRMALPDGLPRRAHKRIELYNQWAQAALACLVGKSDVWNVRVLQSAPFVEGNQWQVRVEGPDGAFVRDIDMDSSQAEIIEVVRSAHSEITRTQAPFARL